MPHFKRNCRRLTGLVFYCLIAAVTYGQTHTIQSSSFGPRQDFITDQNPNGIVIADFDGDGKPDLVSTVVDQVTIHSICGRGVLRYRSRTLMAGY